MAGSATTSIELCIVASDNALLVCGFQRGLMLSMNGIWRWRRQYARGALIAYICHAHCCRLAALAPVTGAASASGASRTLPFRSRDLTGCQKAECLHRAPQLVLPIAFSLTLRMFQFTYPGNPSRHAEGSLPGNAENIYAGCSGRTDAAAKSSTDTATALLAAAHGIPQQGRFCLPVRPRQRKP